MAALTTGDGLNDVVVTAVTSTTSLAPDAEQTWKHLLDKRSGIHTLDRPLIHEFHPPVRIGGALTEDFDEHLNRVELRRLSYLQKMATVLGRRLWDQAGAPEVDTYGLMVSIGLALGTAEEIVIQYDIFKARGLRAVSPLSVQMYMPNSPAAAVGLERQAKAGIVCPLMADASGASAIAEAWKHIALGEADMAICGGVDTWIGPVTLTAFHKLGLLSADNEHPAAASRPFDKHRTGAVFGEAGALLLLENADHAKARGATILARLLGAGSTSDGYDDVLPEPSGESAGTAITRAIESAGLGPEDVDAVIASACGTRPGDQAEANALHHALGAHRPAVYAPKAALGHSWGSVGAVEAVLAVQAIRDGVLPPTLNYETPDPDVDLDVVAHAPRRGEYRHALLNSFGFGGYNVSLVFGAA